MDNIFSLQHMKMIRKFNFLSTRYYPCLFRNLYTDDSKAKDNKTPEPSYTGDDSDGKDAGLKGRRSRGMFTSKRKTKKNIKDSPR